ncbi:MAG: cation-translocating P-type ATPase C-terminal domain-containing protein, partial [Gemmatimonadota bacterium]|nr:cation-translocating P-type ATPase C-terminal domain-containing protein [Gemmatimonadota bacterium]
QLVSVYWAPVASVLGTTPLGLADWGVIVPLALFPGLIGQGLRLVRELRKFPTGASTDPRHP